MGFLIFFAVFALVDWLLGYIEGAYSRKIHTSDQMSEALIYRMRYARNRFWISFVILVGVLIIMVCIDGAESAKYMPLVAGWWIGKRKQLSKHLNPVSWRTIKEVQDTDYILYLRGFNVDSYVDKASLEKQNEFKRFNEYKYVKLLSLYYPVYAVGMTKELYAPNGADRIYLNDNTWESDVHSLINNAKLIVVYLNDSESCIKEITLCASYPNKVLYIIDDLLKFKAVKDYCRKHNLINNLPLLISKEGLYAYYAGPHINQLISLKNTTRGYVNQLRLFTGEQMGWNRWITHFNNSTIGVILFSLVLYTFLMLLLDFPGWLNSTFYIIFIGGLAAIIFHNIPYEYTHSLWSFFPKRIYSFIDNWQKIVKD